MDAAEDPAIVELIVSGDAASFGALFDRHARAVHAYCATRTSDPPGAPAAALTPDRLAERREHLMAEIALSKTVLSKGGAEQHTNRQPVSPLRRAPGLPWLQPMKDTVHDDSC